MTANIEQARLADDGRARGSGGVRTCRSGRGARCARTTAPGGDAWEYLPHDHARSRAYRWNEDGLAGLCDDQQRLCFALVVLERRRPDPEGADLRADRERGQPRRGRQGAVVVPRLDADPLLDALGLPLPAGRVPLRAARRREPRAAAATTPSSSCSTPASSTTTATGTSPSTTPRPRPTTCACGSGSATPAPTRRRCTCCRRCGSATPGRGASTTASRSSSTRTARSWPSTTSLGRMVLVGDGSPERLFCDNESNAQRLWGADGPALSRRTGSATTSCTAPRR